MPPCKEATAQAHVRARAGAVWSDATGERQASARWSQTGEGLCGDGARSGDALQAQVAKEVRCGGVLRAMGATSDWWSDGVAMEQHQPRVLTE